MIQSKCWSHLLVVRAGTQTKTSSSQMSAENCHIFVDLIPEKCYAKNTPTWSRKEMESEKDYDIWNILHENLLFCAYFWKTAVHERQHEWNSTGYGKRKFNSQWQFLVIWYCSLKIHYTVLYFRLWCKYSSYLAWHQHSGPYNISLSTN